MEADVKSSELEQTNQEIANADDKSGGNLLLIVFKLGTGEYALPIDQIKEVVLTPRISQIPQTPPYIKGVANIRGNVISIIDLEERFGLIDVNQSTNGNGTSSSEDELAINSNYTLVIESEEYKIGVLVKEVPNTLSVNSGEIDSSSNIIRHSSLDENAIKGIVKMGDRMIIMLDMLNMMVTGDIQTSN